MLFPVKVWTEISKKRRVSVYFLLLLRYWLEMLATTTVYYWLYTEHMQCSTVVLIDMLPAFVDSFTFLKWLNLKLSPANHCSVSLLYFLASRFSRHCSVPYPLFSFFDHFIFALCYFDNSKMDNSLTIYADYAV
jgi:hypothetical protein